MKKNLACFLAAVMTITAMPVNAFAWGNGNGEQAKVRLANNPPIVANNNDQQVEIGARGDIRRFGDLDLSTNVRYTEDDLFQLTNRYPANDLLVIFPADVPEASPMQFVVELDNANWNFGDNGQFIDQSRGSYDHGSRTYTRFVDPLMLFSIDEGSGELLFNEGPISSIAEVLQYLAVEGYAEFLLPNGNVAGASSLISGGDNEELRNAVATYIYDGIGGSAVDFTQGATVMAALRNLDIAGAPNFRLSKPLYTLEISRGNRSRATVTIADGFDFGDFVANDRNEAIPRQAQLPQYADPSYDMPVAPEAPSTGDVAAPEVVETFGKKKAEEQAPEGETAPSETDDAVQPARTTEAVLVDAMDELDYAAIQADVVPATTQGDYEASVKKTARSRSLSRICYI